MKTLTTSRLLADFAGLFYPRLCLACGKNTPSFEAHICVMCQYRLPKTGFHLEKINPFTEKFWGRLPLIAGASFYFFKKGGLTQKIIHSLKYDGKQEVGIKLGELYGSQLAESPFFKSVDVIIPVPLHPKKEKLRGYNQSAVFAQGLSKTFGRPWFAQALCRKQHTSSQTRKGVIDRLENVETIFEIADPELLKNKHVLLVDDVLTTGATLEACAQPILDIAGSKISMATIAFAQH